MKFSKGPFRVDRETGEIYAENDSMVVGNIYDETDFPCLDDDQIAEVAIECEANRKLIEKAHEMVELLKEIERAYSKYNLQSLDPRVIAVQINIPTKTASAISKLMFDLC